MRNYVVGSLCGHVVLLLAGTWLSSTLSEAAPRFDTIQVNLAQLELPAEAPEPEPQPEPPAPDPPPIPDVPQETSTVPPELVPETLRPKPVVEPELVPPDPDLPPEPEPEPQPDPPPPDPPTDEDLDLPEPEQVVAKPSVDEAPREDPVDSSEEAAPPDLSELRETGVELSAPEGVDDYYLALVKQKIQRRWDPTAASARGRRGVNTVISFHIAPTGNILGGTIVTSSGLTVFDRQALRAVASASPLPRPPSHYGDGDIPITIILTYNP